MIWRTLSAALTLLAAPQLAGAQTDYYNTDRGRPLRIEDAYPVELRAFELQAAPIRLERGAGGIYHWSVEPELAFGILPRTQIEFGVPLAHIDGLGTSRSGVQGLHLSMLHNLNVETSIPALALAASAAFPVGSLAPDVTRISFTGIATRTLSWARFHLNGEYTVGEESAGAVMDEATRWLAGLAIDRALPLRSLLIGAEIVIAQAIDAGDEQTLSAGTGIRYQLSPRLAVDAGFGKRLTGDERPWYFTFGSAYAFGLPWYPRGR